VGVELVHNTVVEAALAGTDLPYLVNHLVEVLLLSLL
jgi:hypothetical protein